MTGGNMTCAPPLTGARGGAHRASRRSWWGVRRRRGSARRPVGGYGPPRGAWLDQLLGDRYDHLRGLGLPLGVCRRERRRLDALGCLPERLVRPVRVARLVAPQSLQEGVGGVGRVLDLSLRAPAA